MNPNTATSSGFWHSDGVKLLCRLMALAALASVAWVFIAPSVDLADSTCSVDEGLSTTQLPAVATAPFSHSTLMTAALAFAEHEPVVSRPGSQVRQQTCSLLC